MLAEHNTRTGFLSAQQVSDVCAHLPEPLRPVVRFGFLSAWRINSEVLTLQWRNVDFVAGEVRLDPGATKNGEGRTFPMTKDMRLLLQQRRDSTDVYQKANGKICPWVFHRHGKPIRSL